LLNGYIFQRLAMNTHSLTYLHGFRSAPQSFKAKWLGDKLEECHSMGVFRHLTFACPQLPMSPREAYALARRHAREAVARAGVDGLTLVGSSLGGFYATHLAEELGCRAVLLNPAVFPQRDLAAHIGPTFMFHSGESIAFTTAHLAEFGDFPSLPVTRPDRYFLIAAKGDELLDWREMVARYPGAKHKVLEGSDHGLSDFAHYGDEVLAFAAGSP
jgi:uncharacterized protein